MARFAWLRQIRREEGQDFVEYGVLIVVVALAAVVGATGLGTAINSWLGAIAGAFPLPT